MTVTSIQRARLYLLHAAEPPAPAVHDYIVVHGPVEAAERIQGGAAPPAVLGEITRPDPRLDHALHAIESGTARLVTPEDEDWPDGLLRGLASRRVDIPLAPPVALWVRGSAPLAEITRTAVAVVGARAATGYGETVAVDLGHDLARRGVTVVTSGEYGIAGAAQRGSLAAGGTAVAVLASGVDIAHPHGHARLFAEIVERGGLLVSEYSIGAVPTRRRLLVRGRLVAAFGAATVVVEAGRRSGALSMAYRAGALGRRVYAVPGPVTSAQSTGVLELLRSGQAVALGSADHIAEIQDQT